MNEEEKQAIEYIRNCLDDEYDFKNATRQKDKEVYKIILELIEKQQEAIEYIQNPTICGRSFDEIVNILTALDIEKQYKIEVTMENLKSLMGIYQSEVEKSIQNAQIKIIDDLTGKGCKIEYTLPHYNFDEENKNE